MSKENLTKFNFFPFQWQYTDEKNDDDDSIQTVIRIYGWNEKNESVAVRIDDFQNPIWVELPNDIEWTPSYLKALHDHLLQINYKQPHLNPVSVTKQDKHKLYYADVEKQEDGTYKKKLYPFLQITFRSCEAVSRFNYLCKKPIKVPKIGNVQLKCHVAEAGITPVLKLIASRKLPSSSWMKCQGKYINGIDKETSRMHEYVVKFTHLKKHPEADNLPIVHPKVLSFDIEVNSTDGSFPKKERPDDKVFQIGCTLTWMEEEEEKETGIKQKVRKYYKECLCLGETDTVTDGVITTCKSESKLLIKFSEFVRKHDPDVIIGYNIFGFDIKYMVERSKDICNCYTDFLKLGCIPGKQAKETEINWESSAYGKQELMYLEVDGRLFIDLLPYIQRNYKLHNYRLETVCDEFLKTNKDPLKAKDLFRIYKSKDPKELGIVANYCIQDTYVTLLLFEKLLIWFDLVEAATTNWVPVVYMYTKGQQIKMYNSMLTYCIENNIVVQSNAFTVDENEQYEGAIVTEPKAGLYKMILPFDFASLYPTIIMAHNIDYSKLVNDKGGKREDIPDEDCYVFKWSRHLNCTHENALTTKVKNKDGSVKCICGDYYYRFLRHSKEITQPDGTKTTVNVSGKGIIPTLLEELLLARKTTRKVIEKNEDRIKELKKLGLGYNAKELEEMNQVLDKRQLAYKVSANSMYGAMGVKKGYLPFLPGAMCVTFKGRESILKASDFLERECGGNVIYNDTDSAYTYFSCLRDKTSEEIWSFAHDVVKKVAKLYPPPMKLEFEDKVYCKFLILTKKRYVGQTIDEDGTLGKKLTKRGIVLQRRDNCRLLRDVYERAVLYILKHIDHLTELNKESRPEEIMKNEYARGLVDLIIKGYDLMDSQPSGSSISSLFNSDPNYSFKDFIITKGLTKETYKSKTPPVHVSVAMKMRERGIVVPPNSRIEYLLLDRGTPYNKNELQNEKAEDVGFYNDNKNSLRIDYLYYLRSQMIKPLDELLRVCIFQKDIVKQHMAARISMNHSFHLLKNIFSPRLAWVQTPTWNNTNLYQYIYEGSGCPYWWKDFFDRESIQEKIKVLAQILETESDKGVIYPSISDVFKMFKLCSPQQIRCIILGQDPYHDGAATGVAFHLENQTEKLNPSLLNILKECKQNGFRVNPKSGDLSFWIKQGVFLLNTALTVKQGEPKSHSQIWKPFIEECIEWLGKKEIPALLWGREAINYSSCFKYSVKTSHPSPLGCNKPCGEYPAFVNSGCFNEINKYISPGIIWSTVEELK